MSSHGAHARHEDSGTELQSLKAPSPDWDYCIVMNNVTEPQNPSPTALEDRDLLRERRGRFLERMRLVGLDVRLVRSTTDQEIYVLLSAPLHRLERQAEHINLEMKLKPQYGGGYAVFSRRMNDGAHSIFEHDPVPGVPEGALFSLTERQLLIRSILDSPRKDGGAGIDVDREVQNGTFMRFYAAHSTPHRQELKQAWAGWRMWKRQPLEMIRSYFGEETTLYFAFLGYYAMMLTFPAVIGLIVFILGKVGIDKDGWAQLAYSIFLGLWATCFLEYWKRRNNTLASEWNMLNFESTERARPGFHGTEMQGVYSNGVFVPITSQDLTFLQSEGLPVSDELPVELVHREAYRNLKRAAGVPVILISLAVVLMTTVGILVLRLWVTTSLRNDALVRQVSTIGVSVLNAVTIIIFNIIYKRIAVALTDWENPRTKTEYDDSLTIKVFLFQFVNSYTGLYYISFFKRSVHFFGSSNPNLWDGCKGGQEVDSESLLGLGCVEEVAQQLLSILLINLLWGQLSLVIIPYFTSLFKKLLAKRKQVGAVRLPEFERQLHLNDSNGMFDEYCLLALQFGYVTLFASSMPLASLIALVTNFVQIRVQAIKVTLAETKPHYRAAQDIGRWYDIFMGISVLAVITNCLLIGFSLPALPSAFSSTQFAPYDRYALTITTIVLLEHVIFALKFLLSQIVPDMPRRARVALAKQAYLRSVAQQAISDEGEDRLPIYENDDGGADFRYESVPHNAVPLGASGEATMSQVDSDTGKLIGGGGAGDDDDHENGDLEAGRIAAVAATTLATVATVAVVAAVASITGTDVVTSAVPDLQGASELRSGSETPPRARISIADDISENGLAGPAGDESDGDDDDLRGNQLPPSPL